MRKRWRFRFYPQAGTGLDRPGGETRFKDQGLYERFNVSSRVGS